VFRDGRLARVKAACHGKAGHLRILGAKVFACLDSGETHLCGNECTRAHNQDDGHSVCALTRTVLADLRPAAHDGWFQANQAKFAMTLVHACKPGCAFVPLPMFACPEFTTCIGGGLFPLVLNAGRGTAEAKNRCFGRPHQAFPNAALFACLTTGKAHFCGRTCDRVTETLDGDAVCEYTGRVLSSALVAGEEPLPAGCVFHETSDFKTEYIRPVADRVDLGRYYAHMLGGIRAKGAAQMREQVFNALLAFATQYIVERAGTTTRARSDSSEQAVRAAIDAYCARKARPSVLALVQIAAAIRSSHPLTVTLTMSAAQGRKHAWTVATRIVALMGIVRQIVPGGKDFIDNMSLKSFFLLGIEMCRQGIIVHHTTLLTPDPILMLISRGDSDAASFWKEHVDARQIPKNLNKLPSQLRALIDRAVTVHRVNPERLRMDEITDHLHVSVDGFDGYRRKA